ncbi:MAG TPA: hypothetical protein VLW25_04245 [Bryobacteraceae bacterium]|nr:hypothetical protein [Bryobacteraceae bacterium]
MRSLIVAGTFFCLLGTAFGQGRGGQYWSLGGFGNVLYPGTGHAPVTPPGGVTGPRYFNGGGRGYGYGGVAHPQHGRGNVVLYPVFSGGYGYGYAPGYGYDPSLGYAPAEGDQPPVVNSGSMPPVVINQNFVPPQANPVVREYGPGGASDDQSGLKMYQAPTPGQSAPQAQPANPDQATIYLLAFRDHNIVQALGYWMEGSTLHYVTMDHDLNQVSLDLIDRDLSQRLNGERGVEFRLPPPR